MLFEHYLLLLKRESTKKTLFDARKMFVDFIKSFVRRRVPRGRFNRFSPSVTSTRTRQLIYNISSKFRKVVRAEGPWFESGQRTFVKLDKFIFLDYLLS